MSDSRIEFNEAEALVERHGVGLRIDDQADTANGLGELLHQREHRVHELSTHALTLCASIDREPCKAQHGQRVPWELLALGGRQPFAQNLGRRHRGKTDDSICLIDGHVCRSDVVTKLILPCIANEEAIEVGIARLEARAIIRWLEAPNFHQPSGSCRTGFPAMRSRKALLGLRGTFKSLATCANDFGVNTN